MKVKLIGRKVYLPKEILEKADLPETGDCEAILVGDEVVLRRENEKLHMIEILKRKPISSTINRMTKAQEVEDA